MTPAELLLLIAVAFLVGVAFATGLWSLTDSAGARRIRAERRARRKSKDEALTKAIHRLGDSITDLRDELLRRGRA